MTRQVEGLSVGPSAGLPVVSLAMLAAPSPSRSHRPLAVASAVQPPTTDALSARRKVERSPRRRSVPRMSIPLRGPREVAQSPRPCPTAAARSPRAVPGCLADDRRVATTLWVRTFHRARRRTEISVNHPRRRDCTEALRDRCPDVSQGRNPPLRSCSSPRLFHVPLPTSHGRLRRGVVRKVRGEAVYHRLR